MKGKYTMPKTINAPRASESFEYKASKLNQTYIVRRSE